MMAGQPGKKLQQLTVTHLDAAAMADWRKQTEAMYPKMKGKMVPPDLFDEVQQLRDQYRAQHPVGGLRSRPTGQGCRQGQQPSDSASGRILAQPGKKGRRLLAISLASLLPFIAMVTRLAGVRGIPGSVVFVQQLTLWIAFLGAGPGGLRRPAAGDVGQHLRAAADGPGRCASSAAA